MLLIIKQVTSYEARVINVKGSFLKGILKVMKEYVYDYTEEFNKIYPNENTG